MRNQFAQEHVNKDLRTDGRAGRHLACFSGEIRRLAGLEKILGRPVRLPRSLSELKGAEAVVVWGARDDLADRLGRMAAAKFNLPLWRLEDGFLRSLDAGRGRAVPWSVVVDGSGIYYDAKTPSDLEKLLNASGWESPELLEQARAARAAIIEADLSRYNCSPPAPPALLGDGSRRRVLLLDQAWGDLSIRPGEAGPETFKAMLAAALAENPKADVFITAPEAAGGRRGHFRPGETGRAVIIGEDYSPLSLLAQADEVYAVTSAMGFEALMLNRPVHCFGRPFYAGWGLTNDRQNCPRRKAGRTLDELFAAACLLYPRYYNPVSGELTDIFEVIRLLSLQRERALANRGLWVAGSFSLRKRRLVRAYLGTPGAEVSFFKKYPDAHEHAAGHGGRVLIWSGKSSPEDSGARARDVPLARMEDGFLRSVGLGSDFQEPWSLVLDSKGIYYDPGRPSGLESILNEYDFQGRPGLLERARRLRLAIVERNITKYNQVGRADFELQPPRGRRVILVPGQVEDDASIRLGSPEIFTNLDLLKEVRRLNPEAFIVYKPHPDVEAGNRSGGRRAEEMSRWADVVLNKVNLACLWGRIDEVRTMTSQVGFEALLRGLPVHTYGLPFYAGWGLTNDRLTIARRRRKLTIDELAAGTLILYPVYYDWNSGVFCGPEEVLGALASGRAKRRHKSLIKVLCREAAFKIFGK